MRPADGSFVKAIGVLSRHPGISDARSDAPPGRGLQRTAQPLGGESELLFVASYFLVTD